MLAWHALDPAAARSLELAHQTLLAGGLAVGSVITGEDGAIVAEGRNRAYDETSGTDVLERTPLAHAEMNALARITTGTDTGHLTIWSTQQPCRMCQAAIEFVGIGQTVAIATDPSDPEVRVVERLPDDWVVLATAMFLVAPVRRGGPEHPTVQANRALEPEALGLAERVAQGDHPLIDGRPLADALGAMWDELQRAASDRRRRRGRGLG
jgi:tRNA(Arg) A34 adenosine deaminase TadA